MENLVVPKRLGGADVVGLASKALDGVSLTKVTLHGNILLIASDAFGESKPTICAYNGTYGLFFAYDNGFKYENFTKYKLVPGVIDYSDAAESRVTRRGDSHVMFGKLEALRLHTGSIFWMLDRRGMDFFYRVKSLEAEGNGCLAEVERPEIAETIIELHVQETIVMTNEDFIPAEGVKVVDNDTTGVKSTITNVSENSKTYEIGNAGYSKIKYESPIETVEKKSSLARQFQ